MAIHGQRGAVGGRARHQGTGAGSVVGSIGSPRRGVRSWAFPDASAVSVSAGSDHACIASWNVAQ